MSMKPIFDRATAERVAVELAGEHDGHVDIEVFEYRHQCGATAFGIKLSWRRQNGDFGMDMITMQEVV